MLNFDKDSGLVPAIVQDANTFQVLMLGYMNQEALNLTKETGRVTFFSRSRDKIWVKGETSGHYLQLVRIIEDCDHDSLLVLAIPHGPTCHTGDTSCFSEDRLTDIRFLGKLEETVKSRVAVGNTEESYTARLAASGLKRIAQKVGEEGLEVALAAAASDDASLLEEGADLLYHLIICLNSRKLKLANVAQVLASREK